MLTFYRKEPFDLEASYAKNTQLPLKDGFIGRFSIKDVVPSKEGESSKIKVKVRLNIHGVLNVVNASLVEKLPPATEPEAESMEVEGQGEKTKEGTEETVAPENTQGTQESNESNESSESQDKEAGIEPMDAETSETKDPKDGDSSNKEDEGKDAKDSKGKKENGAPAKKKKQQVKTVELRVETEVSGLTKSQLQDAIEKECQMILQDKLEREKGFAKNAVESYVYDMRGKLDDELQKYITDEAREKFSELLSVTEDWLYEEGENQSKKVYQDKLAELKKLGDPVETRLSEAIKRPAAFDELGKSIQQIRKILELYAQKDEKYDHIEAEEIKKVEDAVADKDKWFQEKWNAQRNLLDYQDPAVYASVILSEKKLLEDTCYTILNKPKPKPKAEPPPPPKEEEKKEEGTEESTTEEKMDQEGEGVEKPSEDQNQEGGEGTKPDTDMEID